MVFILLTSIPQKEWTLTKKIQAKKMRTFLFDFEVPIPDFHHVHIHIVTREEIDRAY